MALDFSKIKSKLAASQTKGERKDYSKLYFKPTLGKQTVRILPWKEDPTNPFIEVQFHKYDTFKKYIPTQVNFGESDPILEMRKAVYNDPESTEDDKNLMKNFAPKNSIFVQVIERGKEDLGVRLWELNKTNFEAVASIAAEEDEYGDITDIASGRNLIVEGYNELNPKTGKNYVALNIKPSVKQTPLSEDANTAKKWIESQVNPLEQYKRLTDKELIALAEAFLAPKDEEDDETEAPAKPAAKVPAKAPAKAPAAKFKKLDVEEEEAEEVAEEEEETPAPKPKVAAKAPAKPVAKPKPAPAEEEEAEEVDNEGLPWPEEDEAPAPKPKAKPAAKPVAKGAAKSKFADIYGDDEE